MRIAVVHSFYRGNLPSGENQVVDNQVAALQHAGHQVELLAVRSDELSSRPLYGLESAVRVISGFGSGNLLQRLSLEPDVIHVHNTFPNIGYRAFEHARSPIIHTLHNFRPICAAATLFRSGEPCFDCVSGSSLRALKQACYHDSRIQTAPLALRNLRDPGHQGLLRGANALVVGTESARDLYHSFGIANDRLHVIPNGVDSAPESVDARARDGVWLVAARLDPEKGVLDLAVAWPPHHRLEVYGDGLETTGILALGKPNIDYRGVVAHSQLRKRLGQVSGLIVPSKWLEMNPTIVSDALAMGTPIVAFSANAGADLVRRHGVGAVYSDLDSLNDALTSVQAGGRQLREKCLSVFQDNYSFDVWATRLEALYSHLIEHRF